jgi:polar amino acid transport system substrate-binding protein
LRHVGSLCVLFFVAAVLGAQPAPILVNVDEANPPFMYGERSKAMGLYPRLVKAAFAHMPVPLQIEAKPWKRALAELEEGRAGVAGLYKTSERLRKFDYSGQIFVERLMVYFHTENPIAFSRIGDLKGWRIGVIRGWSYGDDFDRLRQSGTLTVEEVAADDQNFQKLATKRLDAVLIVSEAGTALAPGYANLRAAPEPLAVNPTYLAFAQSSKRRDLLKRFDAALGEMRKSGEYQKIVQEELAR